QGILGPWRACPRSIRGCQARSAAPEGLGLRRRPEGFLEAAFPGHRDRLGGLRFGPRREFLRASFSSFCLHVETRSRLDLALLECVHRRAVPKSRGSFLLM